VRYDRDILDELADARRPPEHPRLPVADGLVVADRASGFRGKVVRWDGAGVTLRDERDRQRLFAWKAGGFLVGGRAVTLVRPGPVPERSPRITASGSRAGKGGPRVARPGRIWVEGLHDAELVEQVWGDDLREEGIVVEPLHGADDLLAAVEAFGPGPGRRLGVLLDHLVPGSKESRLASAVRRPHVLVTGHPYVDVWAGIRPAAIGLDAWPDVPPGDVPWKEAVCVALGVPVDGFWTRTRNRVRSYADLEPELVGAVERLVDFVTVQQP
jgi:hypothetical protein